MTEPTIMAQIIARQADLTGLREPSTDNLDLASLPVRLDDATLARVKDIASAPLPPADPSSPRHFNQCLRVMLAVLPKRNMDDVSGELFVAAYQKKLGQYSDKAISFLADTAMSRCQWFPTIAECLEILGEHRRNDEHTERRYWANRIASAEQTARYADDEQWRRIEPNVLTQADVDVMTDQLKSLGLKCGALVTNEDGTVSPWKPDPNAEPIF